MTARRRALAPPGGRDARVAPSPVPPPPPPAASMHVPRSPRLALEPENVPLPKRRSKRVRHPLVIAGNAVFTVLVLVSIAVGAALYFGKQRFEAPGPLAEDKVVNIPRGLGIKDIAELLEREGVIDQPYVFIGGVMVLKARGGLKHGEYQFAKHASLADVVDTIIEGKVVQHALTLPEGLTSEQIVARLLENDALAGKIKEIPREGTLLPETYKFTRGMTREQMIQRMQRAEKTRAAGDLGAPRRPICRSRRRRNWSRSPRSSRRRPAGRTSARAWRGVRQPAEEQDAAAIRSDHHLRPVGGKGSLGRPILKSEIEQPTPYNTYVIDGLPPGPIANPGRASLEAAANPARTKELYFVADGTGGHVFSETYEQHQKNVAQLRAIEQPMAPPATSRQPQPAPTPARRSLARPTAASGSSGDRRHAIARSL